MKTSAKWRLLMNKRTKPRAAIKEKVIVFKPWITNINGYINHVDDFQHNTKLKRRYGDEEKLKEEN